MIIIRRKLYIPQAILTFRRSRIRSNRSPYPIRRFFRIYPCSIHCILSSAPAREPCAGSVSRQKLLISCTAPSSTGGVRIRNSHSRTLQMRHFFMVSPILSPANKATQKITLHRKRRPSFFFPNSLKTLPRLSALRKTRKSISNARRIALLLIFFKTTSPLHFKLDLSSGSLVVIISDSGCVQHAFGCYDRWGILILVTVIYHSFDTGLDDCLGTFVTGEKRNV